jgi:D-psicose/D-tagatose/L-ribulose 3-epimerase
VKLGICGYLTAQNADGHEFDLPAAAKSAGFDYLELPLSRIASLSEAEFDSLRETLDRSGLPCEACNVFFPGTLRLTGSHVDLSAIERYLELALGRAAALGVRVVVFGSAGARNVPDGFPKEQAFLQLVNMLRAADPVAGRHGIQIAIEPLNRAESNILQTGAEGYTLAKLVDRPSIGLLLDYYHMAKDGEDYGIAVTARDFLRHAHFARLEGRSFPAVMEEDFRAFFGALKRAGYNARVSLEAGFTDFATDSPRALAILRELVD